MQIDIPILFLVFNRPDTTVRVFQAIRNVRPPRLYIAADGARLSRNGEDKLVSEVRKIATAVDWPCEVNTLFREKNLGCKYAVSKAISWFFDNEEMGIIIEDDVLPNDDFFFFVESMLMRYRSDARISMVTGTNYLSNSGGAPYFFSEHMTIWGWGTWKRAWAHYEVEMDSWRLIENQIYLKNKFSGSYIWKHYRNSFNKILKNEIDTWDIQWVYSCFINSSLCVTPGVNLISNIGIEGSHVSGVTDSHFMKQFPIDPQKYLTYQPKIHINYEYDLSLHRLKTIKSVRNEEFLTFLKKIHMYNILRFMKRSLLSLIIGFK